MQFIVPSTSLSNDALSLLSGIDRNSGGSMFAVKIMWISKRSLSPL